MLPLRENIFLHQRVLEYWHRRSIVRGRMGKSHGCGFMSFPATSAHATSLCPLKLDRTYMKQPRHNQYTPARNLQESRIFATYSVRRCHCTAIPVYCESNKEIPKKIAKSCAGFIHGLLTKWEQIFWVHGIYCALLMRESAMPSIYRVPEPSTGVFTALSSLQKYAMAS